jgi:osmoprotectant transport system ATP-binding protein
MFLPTPPVSDSVVEFWDVTFRVNQRNLVANLNFQVNRGEALVLIGRSGSGKSTTIALMDALRIPTHGEVLVEGKPTTQWDPIQLRRRMGYVIQDIGLFPHFTVAKNVGLVPSLQGWEGDRIQHRVTELLELVGLEPQHFLHRYPHQLSGGQRQRIGVARALAADPPVLLMDEPFGALDPITRLELQREFKHLQQQLGKTVIFVTHDIHEALRLATRIGLMQDGKMVMLGSPTEFLQSEHPEAQAFIRCLPTPSFDGTAEF